VQILVTSTQFRLIYHRMAELIRDDEETRDLAIAMNLRDECDDDEDCHNTATLRAISSTSPMGALVGMDMHPRQNVYQASPLFFLVYAMSSS
jgi:hypothetical protein